ncbi:hypothetical protein CYL18_03520 [Pradoshia eiseniae]|uniref:DUF819 domain-containing protein n=1 Tax=Pradoshia eiseniae TaxID=2064768 RepID=A0A2S7N4S6_9BACI|nr:DUF819 family protein [Pradoshia eiseniae]PQD96960.1 hypothetical protein CYL18_03520 [Pradoshia eiseniae]
MDNTLIKADDIWLLWAFLAGWAAVSIYLEQKYKWASKLSGAIIALLGAMILANLKIIPTESAVYDTVWGYVIPLAIPLLLYQANIVKIMKESGRLLIMFFLSSAGTVAGVIIAFFLLKEYIPGLEKVAAMMTGSYIGGGVNFAALSTKFEAPGELVSATVVADNLMMAIYFFVLILIPTIPFIRKHFRTPHIDQMERDNAGENKAAAYWKGKEISLKDIALSVGTAFTLVAISFKLAEIFGNLIPSGENTNFFFVLLKGTLGDKYLVLTTLTILAVSIFSRYFENLKGAQEIGTYLIYIFFVVIGVPASISLIISQAPLLLAFVAIIVVINLAISLLLGKVFKFNLEEIILASNANVGGPTTAAAMAISKGWTSLIVPILLVGTLGYIVGNYAGSAIGYWFSSLL